MSSNIEKFDRLAGKIFADLYESFPIPLVMLPSEYSLFIQDDSNPDDSQEGFTGYEARRFYEATHRWLERSGFIEVERKAPDGSTVVVLTNKALEALKIVPGSLAGEESLGERLTHAARDGATDQIRSLTGKVLGAGLQLGWGFVKSQGFAP